MPEFNPLNRRHLLKYGGGFIGVSLMATVFGNGNASLAKTLAKTEAPHSTPAEALQKLLLGNNRFVTNQRTNCHQNHDRLVELAQGQSPFAAILGCADSRVPTEIIFDQGLGDLFVCRIAGNVASAQEIGSLEFGTVVLGAKVIMVLGHESCGAVKAAVTGGDLPGQIGDVVKKIDIGGESKNLEAAIKANVAYQVRQLEQSPLLTDLIAQQKLLIVGAYYELQTGKVTLI